MSSASCRGRPKVALENEENFANVQKSQVALLKSHDILSEAIVKSRASEKYGVSFSARKLAKDLMTNFNEGPEVLTVGLSGDDPDAVAALLNALGEVYPQRVLAADEQRVKNRIDQLRRRLLADPNGAPGKPTSLTEQLRQKRVELRLAEQKAKLFDMEALASKHGSALVMLQGAQSDLREKKSLRTGLEAELASKERRLQNPDFAAVSESEAEESIKGNTEYADLVKEIALKKKQIDEVRRVAKPRVGEKILAVPRSELQKLEKQRDNLIKEAREKLADKLRSRTIEQLKGAVADLKDKIEQTKKQETSMETEVRRWSSEVELFPRAVPRLLPKWRPCATK